MTLALLILLGLLLVVYFIFFSGRRPVHYRGIREGDFDRFLANLPVDGIGSRLFVENEGTSQVLTIEKRSASRDRQGYVVRSRTSGSPPAEELRTALPDGIPTLRVSRDGAGTEVEFECDRASVVGVVRSVVRSMLTWGGALPAHTYHLHFDSKYDPEWLRDKYEAKLRDPDATRLGRRIAEQGLRALDRRLGDQRVRGEGEDVRPVSDRSPRGGPQ
jgi:hypothetical protein